jgi:FKBP-type peptidyl-prolyl cis-trans isomerase
MNGDQTVFNVVREGTGPAVVSAGSKVKVHAVGTVKETNKTFWSTHATKQPFEYVAGRGNVIVGWDQGCLGMNLVSVLCCVELITKMPIF